MSCHFPPPWTVEPLDAGYKVVDANGRHRSPRWLCRSRLFQSRLPRPLWKYTDRCARNRRAGKNSSFLRGSSAHCFLKSDGSRWMRID